jgi:superfamily II DNA or RNA helicase
MDVSPLSNEARDLFELLCVAHMHLLESKVGALFSQDAIEQLVAHGLVRRVLPDSSWLQQQGPSLHCDKDAVQPVVRQLAHEGRLPEFKKRVESSTPELAEVRRDDGYRLQLALYGNLDPQVFEHLARYHTTRGHEPLVYSILMRPFDSVLWPRLPQELQIQAAINILGWCLHRPDDPRPLLDILDASQWPAEAQHRLLGVHIEILAWSGRADEAAARVEQLPAAVKAPTRDRWHVDMDDLPDPDALRGLVAFMQNRLADAILFFDSALKTHRRVTRSRKTALPGDMGLFHILALYQDRQVERGAELAEMGNHYWGARESKRLAAIAEVLSGHRLAPPQHPVRHTFEVLLESLLHTWNGTMTDDLTKSMRHLHERATHAGFVWIADQVGDLLGLPPTLPYPTLSSIVATQHPWERVLHALRGLAPAVVEPATSRLAWFLGWKDKQVTTVEVREQQPRSGGWTRGKTIALEAVSKTACATEQDVRVAAAMDRERRRILVQLVGHPRVFWSDAPETAVEVVRVEPQMRVQRVADGLELVMVPAAGDVTAERESHRLCVYVPSPEQVAMADLLKGGLRVPEQGRASVVDTLSALAGVVAVQSDVASDDVLEVPSDTRLYVQLAPRGEGVTMRVRVRPLGDGGPTLAPGAGAAVLMDTVHGAPRQTQRDLHGEKLAWRRLQAACGTDNTADIGETLELLSILRHQGEGVIIEWPQGGALRVARQTTSSFRVRSDKDWFAVDGGVTLDDGKVVDMRTLLAGLEHARGRFVPLGEDGFVALEQSLLRRLEALRAYGEVHGSTLRFHPLAAPALEEALEGTQSDARWQAHLSRLATTPALDLPATLHAELRDYQVDGFRWLARLAAWQASACLADDMGLGKTLQALAFILHRGGPTLVVAPTSVCYNWLAEARRFAPTLRARLYAGAERASILADVQTHDLVVCSYTIMQLDVEALQGVTWHTIVLDEAQAIKNATTQRSKAALSLRAGFRLALTGTPIENHLGELWTLFRFLLPGLLGTSSQFQKRFAGPIERDGSATARTRLRRLVAPFMLRRTKPQVLEQLPPRIEITLSMELSEAERALYEATRRQALEEVAAAGPLQILAAITKLRRTACNSRLVLPGSMVPSAKLEALDGLLADLRENRHRALIFSQFTDHLAIVREHLESRGVTYQYLDGATPMGERRDRVNAFQEGLGDVFLISLKAGGTGLNLTAADYVIHLDPWWNPAVEDQASDRAHRIGQERPVTIYRLIAKGTIEEQIVRLHLDKRNLAESLLEGSEAAARLSTEELLALLRASPDGS